MPFLPLSYQSLTLTITEDTAYEGRENFCSFLSELPLCPQSNLGRPRPNTIVLNLLYLGWVHTAQYSCQVVVMRQIVTTNRSQCLVCTHYMCAPMVRNDVVPLAMHAAQYHGIELCDTGTSFPAAGTHCTVCMHCQ